MDGQLGFRAQHTESASL